jgi:protein required for attachment to host cells
MMKKIKKWVLVADGGMAKILTYDDKKIQVIHQLQSPFQHAPSKDIATDKDGNFYAGKHHSKGNSADLHDQAESEFISSVSDLLEKEFYAGQFSELNLILPPRALGKLRQSLGKNIQASINKEVSKDLINYPENELHIKLNKLLKP